MESQTIQLPYISKPNEISNNEYHTGEKYIDFVSSSVLKLIETSPKWLRYCQLNPNDKRISLEADLKGSVYHSMLASIANTGSLIQFEQEFAVFDPPINPSTGNPYGYDSKKFGEAFTEFQIANPNKEICSQSEVDLSNTMIYELTKGNDHLSKDINFLLKHGKGEISHFCEYQGGLFKYRTDLKTSTKIIDWKTCRFGRAKKNDFSKQILEMGYHISAAFYQFFDFITTGKWRTFYWVAQEKEPPYDFNIIDASNWAWEISGEAGDQIAIPHLGAQIMMRLVEQYLICKESDNYPGYSVFTMPDYRNRRISISPIPGYANKDLLTFYN